jgi:hypothetical protein
MEIEESQPNLAPIAEPEMPLQQEEEEPMANEHKIQKNVATSSATDDTGRNFAESVIGPNDNGNGGGNQPKVGMVRMRRKRRRLDPFGNLILSTKKMKLNDSGIPGASAVEGQQQAEGSVECGEDDELVFYYGGEDDSADGYDDDEDSNGKGEPVYFLLFSCLKTIQTIIRLSFQQRSTTKTTILMRAEMNSRTSQPARMTTSVGLQIYRS